MEVYNKDSIFIISSLSKFFNIINSALSIASLHELRLCKKKLVKVPINKTARITLALFFILRANIRYILLSNTVRYLFISSKVNDLHFATNSQTPFFIVIQTSPSRAYTNIQVEKRAPTRPMKCPIIIAK